MVRFSRALILRGFVLIAVSLCHPIVSRADEETPAAEREASKFQFSEVSENGFFFLNGEFLEAPYTIEATSESLSVNGISCSIDRNPFQDEFEDEFNPEFRGRGRGDGGGSRRNRFGNRDRTEDEDPGFVPRFGAGFGPKRSFASRRIARGLFDALSAGQFVFAFDESQELVVIPRYFEPELSAVLLNEHPTEEHLQEMTGFSRKPGTQHALKEWLESYSPPDRLRTLLTARLEKITQTEASNLREVAAMHRLNNYSYPLTLLGMMVGVVSLGHLLRWPQKEDAAEAGSETVRAVGFALCLMLVMALIDLIWTILATQAGMMKEVNPLAEKLVDTPLQLAIFKTFATAVGFGIFYTWRKRRQIQVATWWMCLVCVLVTFRWVIFDSAMSP